MPKANINLPNGTKIIIEGSVEDVAKIISLVKEPRHQPKKTRKPKAKTERTKKKKEKKGPTFYILELKKRGFFKDKRMLEDVIKVLKTKGQIYPSTTISPIMLKLVRKEELKRLKEQKKWKYFQK